MEYNIFKKKLVKLNDILTGEPDLIIKLAMRLSAEDIITETTKQKAAEVHLSAVNRAFSLLNSVLIALRDNPNQKKMFDSFNMLLDDLGINTTKHQGNLRTFCFITYIFLFRKHSYKDRR